MWLEIFVRTQFGNLKVTLNFNIIIFYIAFWNHCQNLCATDFTLYYQLLLLIVYSSILQIAENVETDPYYSECRFLGIYFLHEVTIQFLSKFLKRAILCLSLGALFFFVITYTNCFTRDRKQLFCFENMKI